MLNLLIMRAAALLLRPAVVVLEGAATSHAMLVLMLPVVAMALIMSSVPVHLNYFRSHPGLPGHERLRRLYEAALTWLTLGSLAVLLIALLALPLEFGAALTAATCVTFLLEKLAAETSRALEFRKAFTEWFLLQLLRSGWMLLPVAAAVAGLPYEESLLAAALVSCAVMFIVFRSVTGIVPRLDAEGLPPIRDNLVFLVGSFLTASYQQLPRIAIAKLFPEYAHVYLAVAQVCQGVGLVFNVRLQIPYRKLIARRPVLFQRRVWPAVRRILVPVGGTALVYLLLSAVISPSALSNIALAAILMPVMVADALMFSILVAHLGFIHWFARKRSALVTYVLSLAASAIVMGLVVTPLIGYISLFSVPALTIGAGFIFLFVTIQRHFSGRMKHV